MSDSRKTGTNSINRRQFIAASTAAGLWLSTGPRLLGSGSGLETSKVYMVKGTSRAAIIPKLLDMFGRDSLNSAISGKWVIVKPNFNSAHEFPGISHHDTVKLLLSEIGKAGPAKVTVTDRSGMGKSSFVVQKMGLDKQLAETGAELIPFDNLSKDDLVRKELKDSHWSRGVEWPKMYDEADCIISTCCLKTHQYGGHFTMSLKNSVGMVARFSTIEKHDYMIELHRSPHQRRMIAEINLLYQPALVLLDALKCFTDGGPHVGTAHEPGIMTAGTDRIAIDAVGVAMLRYYGTTPEVSKGKIFEQEQIQRAAELGLGATGVDQIEIVTDGGASEEFAEKIRSELTKG